MTKTELKELKGLWTGAAGFDSTSDAFTGAA